MSWPIPAIDICLTSCACLTGARCWSSLIARALSRTHEKRATIFSAIKTTGNATMVIWLACSIHRPGRRSQRVNKNRAKPNGERIPEFRDSARESLELELFSTEPNYDDYEILRLTDSLTDFASQFGANDPLVQKVVAGKSPHARAVELVTGTKLKDVAF